MSRWGVAAITIAGAAYVAAVFAAVYSLLMYFRDRRSA